MDILIIGLLLVLIYYVPQIPLTKHKGVKKWLRTHCRHVSSGERMMKHSLIILLVGILAVTLYYLGVLKLPDMAYMPIGKSIVAVILSILAFIQVFFLISIVICRLLKLEQDATIKPIDLLAVDPKHFFYTGYIVPILVAVFETYIFYDLLVRILTDYKIPLFCSLGIIILAYSLLKAIMRRESKKSLAFFVVGIAISTIGILLTLGSNPILGAIYMFFVLLFLAFKNMKVTAYR